MSGDGPQELERLAVGPVNVLQHQHLGPVGRGGPQRVHHLGEDPLAHPLPGGGVGDGVGVPAGQALGRRRAGVTAGVAQAVDPGRERQQGPALPASAPPDGSAGRPTAVDVERTTVVLPMPASPATRSRRPRPSSISATAASPAARTRWRPMSTSKWYGQGPEPSGPCHRRTCTFDRSAASLAGPIPLNPADRPPI